MTGVADLYLYLKKPHSKDRWYRLSSHFVNSTGHTKFAVLSWKRTGSNLLCGILHNHPDITMHNELFNTIDIFTYHPSFKTIQNCEALWTPQTRDLDPVGFLRFVWSGMLADGETPIKPGFKAVGFKSFPEHWITPRNEDVWQQEILEDLRVKKIILWRQDELAVFISMKRAEKTNAYMTHQYPSDLTIHVDPAEFQRFLNNYNNTFQNKYRSPISKRDTFIIEYEQLVDPIAFEEIAPKLWRFLGVQDDAKIQTLKETVRQSKPNENLSLVISNYEELEFCFRHSKVKHFVEKKEKGKLMHPPKVLPLNDHVKTDELCWSLISPLSGAWKSLRAERSRQSGVSIPPDLQSWSLLVPICSRAKSGLTSGDIETIKQRFNFNSNRFLDLALSSQHIPNAYIDRESCWQMLENFAKSLKATSSSAELKLTECIVGIDEDDILYSNKAAKIRIRKMFPCAVHFVSIKPAMYGHVCKIWNHLGRQAKHDYIVLLGDDIRLLDQGWQQRIVRRFYEVSENEDLPLGAACVAMKDLAFPGFPTFPVVHRWHVGKFGSIIPQQFANQGGDPYLYELYSRYNASSFEVTCRLENTIGGDGDARYLKHQINWRAHVLTENLKHLRESLGNLRPRGICLDVVVPSYRTNNNEFLKRILLLRATVMLYVRFWIVVDNPLPEHIESVKNLANGINETSLKKDCNYFVNVIHYAENRGASYARNMGYNFTTADWVLFLDDDVIPEPNILDAYAGAIKRYPEGKVFVGLTNLPEACNLWTQMLCTCNVGYFYGIAKETVRPSWGVTANLMVRGARCNHTIQFKQIFPKTGGGEDIDFVYQYKKWHHDWKTPITVGVPEAVVSHPWWNSGQTCYSQIMGWAWGDSICITEWPEKTFLVFPNWIELIVCLLPIISVCSGQYAAGIHAALGVFVLEHLLKGWKYFDDAKSVCEETSLRTCLVALGAGSVLSSQEVTRTIALIRRQSFFSFSRRVDWFDGSKPNIQLDIQLGSIVRFGLFVAVIWSTFRNSSMLSETEPDVGIALGRLAQIA
ncbi:unnamed protein product [Cylindrotheca closterium]|uniref:Glycosyltransferase 2-like domain-containing protein n=1 Tax=Cylindrotheca closterium TaxID=2856 RepID=A0AAD2FLF5_9STRA|nr:unnamed protein product [Cylindrotheca closterium]